MRVQAAGAAQTAAKLEHVSAGLRELPVMAEVGEDIADTARSLVRRRSGALAGTIRADHTRTTATVRAGAGLIYAPVQERGGYHHITPNRFMAGARDQAAAGSSRRTIETAIHGLIRSTGI